MASNPILVLFLLSFMIPVLAEEATRESKIELDDELSPKVNLSSRIQSSWLSRSGHFAFGFYRHGDGYAVGIWLVGANESDNTLVWTANRDDPPFSPNSTLKLTTNGLLLRRGSEDLGELLVASEPAISASMLDSGTFVIYGQEGTSYAVWKSFHHPTDTILGGQNLTFGNNLVSSMSKSDHSSGRFLLGMQSDYNLVAYPMNSRLGAEDAYWDSYHVEQFGRAGPLQLSREGFLCLEKFQCLANNTNLRKNSHNPTTIYRATLDVDGNFRLYEHRFEAKSNPRSSVRMLWQALDDKCQIKGFCGLNSYCSNASGNTVCACYPGFVPSENNSTMFLDCKLNYSKDDCEKSERILLYNVDHLEEMSWDVDPYLVMPMTMEACEKSCKEDCDCAAALYASGRCNKYSLPLRYGRRIPKTLSTALFKVPPLGYISSRNHTILPPKKPRVVADNKRSLIMILVSTLGSISLICVVYAIIIFFTYRYQAQRYTKLSASSSMGFTEECSLRSFSFDELVKATNGFTEEVGRGSFGAVYSGTIGDSNKRVAVKRLERIVGEGERKFRAEITAIARTHHRNLVKLIGFCIDGSRKLLVYEYVSNGSLANLLFKSKKHLPLKERLKIALDMARGVQYLHEECEVHIIHCNIKPQNILMDEMWTAKISDFGLAKLLKPEHLRNETGDQGTGGYLAPEWQKEAYASVKADIYSYGVVLLEIVCRRRGIEVNVSSPEEILLSSWVYQCFATGHLNKLLAYDEKGDGDEDESVIWKTLERMVRVALWCVQDDPSLRPSMKNVILMLEGWKDVPIPPPLSL